MAKSRQVNVFGFIKQDFRGWPESIQPVECKSFQGKVVLVHRRSFPVFCLGARCLGLARWAILYVPPEDKEPLSEEETRLFRGWFIRGDEGLPGLLEDIACCVADEPKIPSVQKILRNVYSYQDILADSETARILYQKGPVHCVVLA